MVEPPALAGKPQESTLEKHLAAWEKKTAGVTNYRAEISLKRTDVVFKKETNFTGVVLCMKPAFAVLWLDNAADPAKTDYEAYICDSKSLYVYEGLKKTITEIKLPPKWPLQDASIWVNPVFAPLSDPKGKKITDRLDVTLFKTDENYVYFDVKPRRPQDEREFKQLRLALYGPKHESLAYLPAQVFVLKPNDDTEVWKFTNAKADLLGVDDKTFRFVPIPWWKVHRVPPAPPWEAGKP